jgi:GntR family transcriptional regulator
MVVSPKGLPLYFTIAEDLRAKIRSGSIRGGEKLPTQRKLAAEYSTTLMTVRQALGMLEEEELLRTEHGVGMFATQPRIDEYERERIHGFELEMEKRNQRIVTRMLTGPGPLVCPAASRSLGAPEAAALTAMRRLRVLDGLPIVLQSSFLAPGMDAVLDSFEPGSSLYERIAEKTGISVAITREILSPIVLDDSAAAALERRPGETAMMSARLSLSSEGDPLVYDEAVIAGDSFFLSAERAGKRCSYEFNFRKGGPGPILDAFFREE